MTNPNATDVAPIIWHPEGTPGPWHVEDPMGSNPGDSLWIVQEGATSEVYHWRNVALVCSDDPVSVELGESKPITTKERDANARAFGLVPNMVVLIRHDVAEYDRLNPMRTADQHHVACPCQRCVIDAKRAILSKLDGAAS